MNSLVKKWIEKGLIDSSEMDDTEKSPSFHLDPETFDPDEFKREIEELMQKNRNGHLDEYQVAG